MEKNKIKSRGESREVKVESRESRVERRGVRGESREVRVESRERGEQIDDKSMLDGLDALDEEQKEYRRWEADEERAAMFEQEEKRPWLSVGGLMLGLLCWIALFALPKPGFENLDKQLYAMMAVTLAAFLMSFFGRKRAFGMSVIGMLVSGGLMLFLIIALVVLLMTK